MGDGEYLMIRPNVHLPEGAVEMNGGWYEPDELDAHTDAAKAGPQAVLDRGYSDTPKEADRFVQRFTAPLQGALFGDPGEDQDERSKATFWHADIGDQQESANPRIRKALADSRMPNSLIKALGGISRTDLNNGGKGYSGAYEGETNTVLFAPDKVNQRVTLHELGHRGDFIANAPFTRPDDYRNGPGVVPARAGSGGANARLEGVADGLEDRYATVVPNTPGDYAHFRHTGYSTQYPGWQSPVSATGEWEPTWNNATYAAARSHAYETGEVPTEVTAPAYLHMMRNISPYAREAWKQHGMEGVVDSAANQYLRSRRVGIQQSMFSERMIRPHDKNDTSIPERSLGFFPHPAITGTQADPGLPPLRPGEERYHKSLDYDVHDIPESHKPRQ
jgi:hypothetical protein